MPRFAALFAVPILAIVQAARHKMPDSSAHAFSSLQALFENSSTSPSNYALALYSGLWAFDGWDQSSYVAGEMKVRLHSNSRFLRPASQAHLRSHMGCAL